MPHVMTVYGTRPEAIKVAPVIRALERSDHVRSVTVVTGQHREMLDQVNEVFGIVPDHDLDVFAHGQTLNALMSKVFDRVDPVLVSLRPDAVLVQGDTSTVAAVAVATFYRQIPVFHLEAGLRSGDIASPFPEEANRRLTSQVAALHLAPTAGARRNLEREDVDPASIVVTGNTIIDALQHAATQPTRIADARLQSLVDSGRPILLVTTHRRENWGQTMQGIGRALRRLALAMMPLAAWCRPSRKRLPASGSRSSSCGRTPSVPRRSAREPYGSSVPMRTDWCARCPPSSPTRPRTRSCPTP